jgi:glycosyltransferase involved in cell wall biosynthesis
MAKVALGQGYKVVLLSFETKDKHPKIEELESLGLKRITRPSLHYQQNRWVETFYLARNYLRKKWKDPYKILFAHDPDIVVYNGTCYSIANEPGLISLIRKRNSVFYIVGHLNHDLHRFIDESAANRILAAYNLCKRVFFVSQRNKETAERQLCAAIDNIEIVSNPVNLETIEYIPFPNADEVVKFALVGNLVLEHKGQDLIIAALSKWSRKNWILNIYGQGRDKKYLRQLSEFYNLNDKIKFHGKVNDVSGIWKTNHILLMPSHMEGMPLAVVEAMLCGRFCIGTDVGGLKEWITHGKNGFLADAPTANCLLRALGEAWKVKNKWEQIGMEAYATAIKRYDQNAGKSLLKRITIA